MTLHLAADVFATSVADNLVLLDLNSERYLCLSGVALAADGRLDGPVELLAELAEAGLAAPGGPHPGLFPRSPPPPARSLEPAATGAFPAFADGTRAVLDALVGYCSRPMAALVREAARHRRAPAPEPSPEALACAAAFQGWAPFLPLSAKCLLRSFLLLRLLRRRGCDAVWVFGVRTWPFQAHCWLQAGEVVLDDHWERVAGYTPILAV